MKSKKVQVLACDNEVHTIHIIYRDGRELQCLAGLDTIQFKIVMVILKRCKECFAEYNATHDMDEFNRRATYQYVEREV